MRTWGEVIQMDEQLRTLVIDTEKGIYKVNGRTISKTEYLNLVFENGVWSLVIKENSFYTASGQSGKEDFRE